jgi:hypothetical protein
MLARFQRRPQGCWCRAESTDVPGRHHSVYNEAVMLNALRLALVCAALLAACTSPPAGPPLQVERNFVIVDNRTSDDWLDVEIWVNRQYRVTAPRIAAGTRFTTTLDSFVAGFGQRFDAERQRVDDLRLTARTPGDDRVEIER